MAAITQDRERGRALGPRALVPKRWMGGANCTIHAEMYSLKYSVYNTRLLRHFHRDLCKMRERKISHREL